MKTRASSTAPRRLLNRVQPSDASAERRYCVPSVVRVTLVQPLWQVREAVPSGERRVRVRGSVQEQGSAGVHWYAAAPEELGGGYLPTMSGRFQMFSSVRWMWVVLPSAGSKTSTEQSRLPCSPTMDV